MQFSNDSEDLSPAARPQILVVDDDARIRDLVMRYLNDNGFVALEADGAATAREILQTFEFDALVVDVMMPGESGLAFTRDLRARQNIPVLLLTALGDAPDRIAGLESGADDYLPKPFEPRELLLRLRAILRRAPPRADLDKGFRIGAWIFDPGLEELRRENHVQKLTPAEMALLRALASRPNEPVTREELARKCGLGDAGRTVDVQVTRLRRKIEDGKIPRHLLTLRGKGYMLKIEEV